MITRGVYGSHHGSLTEPSAARSLFFLDRTPYDRRQDVYLDATAIVSLHHAHLESRFSFRTRLLDALWGRVPILCTSGDVVAGIVEELQLGLTVPPGDVDAVAQAFRELAADPALLDRARVHLETAAPAYEWEHAVSPLPRARGETRADAESEADPEARGGIVGFCVGGSRGPTASRSGRSSPAACC